MLAQIRIFEIFHGLVAERESNPRDDIISVIMDTQVDDDDEGTTTRKLDAAEVAIRFQEIAFAGHETVAKAIPNGTIAFTDVSRPAPAARVRPVAVGSRPPTRCCATTRPRSCRAAWRSRTSRCTASRSRQAHGSCSRRPRRFAIRSAYPDPDRFDITRESDPSTIYFGFGVHRCIGAHLARLEMRVAFEELVTRFPNFAVDKSRAVRHVSSNVRGVAHCRC